MKEREMIMMGDPGVGTASFIDFSKSTCVPKVVDDYAQQVLKENFPVKIAVVGMPPGVAVPAAIQELEAKGMVHIVSPDQVPPTIMPIKAPELEAAMFKYLGEETPVRKDCSKGHSYIEIRSEDNSSGRKLIKSTWKCKYCSKPL